VGTYVLRRLLLFVPALLGVTVVIFVLMRLVPGDIAEILAYEAGAEFAGVAQKQIQQIRQELGLDQPLLQQYAHWLGGALTGDFGYSYWEKRPVVDILQERFPRSLELALLTMVLAILWAVPLGVISAVRHNTWADYAVRVLSISGLSLPLFLTGILLLYGLVRFFHWMPPLDFRDVFDDPVENLQQLLWPALAQAFYISAPITRLTRSQMLDIIRGPCAHSACQRRARARCGLSSRPAERPAAGGNVYWLVGRAAAGRDCHYGNDFWRPGHGHEPYRGGAAS
jgi:peptide/nickel transport system permease protein